MHSAGISEPSYPRQGDTTNSSGSFSRIPGPAPGTSPLPSSPSQRRYTTRPTGYTIYKLNQAMPKTDFSASSARPKIASSSSGPGSPSNSSVSLYSSASTRASSPDTSRGSAPALSPSTSISSLQTDDGGPGPSRTQQSLMQADEEDILHGFLRIRRHNGEATQSFKATAENIPEFVVAATNNGELKQRLADQEEETKAAKGAQRAAEDAQRAAEDAQRASEERLRLLEEECEIKKRKQQEKKRRRREQERERQEAQDAEIQELKDANKNLGIRFDQVTAALQSKTEENGRTRSELNEANLAIGRLRRQLDEATTAGNARQGQLDQANRELANSDTLSLTLQGLLGDAGQALAAERQWHAETQQLLIAEQTKVAELEGKVSVIQRQLANAERSREEAQNLAGTTQHQLDGVQATLSQTQQERDSAIAEADTQQRRLGEAQEALARTEKSLMTALTEATAEPLELLEARALVAQTLEDLGNAHTGAAAVEELLVVTRKRLSLEVQEARAKTREALVQKDQEMEEERNQAATRLNEVQDSLNQMEQERDQAARRSNDVQASLTRTEQEREAAQARENELSQQLTELTRRFAELRAQQSGQRRRRRGQEPDRQRIVCVRPPGVRIGQARM